MTTFKKIGILLLGIIMLGTSGCIDIIEEITLKKDGSGTFIYTMDMGRILKQGLLDQMKNMVPKKEGEEKTEEDKKKPMEIDSVARFYDIIPSETMKEVEKPEFWKKALLKMNFSESKNVAKFGFELPFEKVSEIDYFFKEMNKMSEKNKDMAGPLGGMFKTFDGTQSLFKLKKRKLTRLKQPKMDLGMDVGGDNKENMEMMKMMFTGSKYTTIYHFPGKVKKTSNSNARISADGKTVTLSQDMLDVMEGKAELENTIKFKKK